MIIFKDVTECDFTDEKYGSTRRGVAYIAQGATGRWCEVMHGGPSMLKQEQDNGSEILLADEARRRCDAMENSYADF